MLNLDAPLVHGIVRLRRDAESVTGVAVAYGDEADIREPADLPEHRLEMHVFPGDEQASGFALGIAYAGLNALHAAAHGRVALVARLDEERPQSAATLEDSVSLHVHGVTIDRIRADAAAFEQSRIRLERYSREHDEANAAWRPLVEALAGFPPKASAQGGSLWDVAQAMWFGSAENATIRGTFDPDPPVSDGDWVQEFLIEVRRRSDGTLLLWPSDMLHVTRESAQARIEAFSKACFEAGWTFNEEGVRPECVCRADESLREALAAWPALWTRLCAISEECGRLARARAIIGNREYRKTLVEMSEGRAIRQDKEHAPGRLETARGGRNLSARLIGELAYAKLIDLARWTDHRGWRFNLEWGITDIGQAALDGDPEALARKMKAAEARG